VIESDDELRARFAELRAADARGAPDFRGVLDRANHSPHADSRGRRWLSPLAISVAAAAVVVAAVGISRVSRRAAFVAPPLSSWTSPTAGLLRTPAFDRARPASVISTLVVIATAIPRTGTNR
jgi:hypothetical protein